MTLFEKVKLAIRIKTDRLNSEIQANIDSARAEMVRAGVADYKAEDETDALVTDAIIMYVKSMMMGDAKEREGYEKSFYFKLENLRKSGGYRA